MISMESYPGGPKHRLTPGIFAKARSHRIHKVLANFGKYNRLASDAAEKLGGEFVFDMRYLVCFVDDAFGLAEEILRDVNTLSGFRHNRLFGEKQRLRTELRYALAWQPLMDSENLVIPFSELDELEHYHEIGGNLAKLAAMRRQLELPMPDGFVISTSAFGLFVEFNELEGLPDSGELPASIAQIEERICSASIPPDLDAAINKEVERVRTAHGQPVDFILTGELQDGRAGQAEASSLKATAEVRAEELVAGYKSILSFLLREALRAGGLEGGGVSTAAVSVAVTRRLNTQSKGLIFTLDPEDSQRNHVVIETEEDGRRHLWRASRHCPSHVQLPLEHAEGAGIVEAEVAGLAEKALRVERYLGKPQRITWAREGGTLYFTELEALRPESSGGLAPYSLSDAVKTHEILYQHEGKVASPGIGCGMVHIARDEEGPEAFPDHAVIVLRDFEPSEQLIRHLPMASAVLADRGAPVGHAASVVREFHVPALVGLVDATTRLREGAFVTVDADDNTVYAGEVGALASYHLLHGDCIADEREYRLLRLILHRLRSRTAGDLRGARRRPRRRRSLEGILRAAIMTACEALSTTMIAATPKLKAAGVQLNDGRAPRWTLVDLGGGLGQELGARRQATEDSLESVPFGAFHKGLRTSRQGDSEKAHSLAMAAISRERMHAMMESDFMRLSLHACCGAITDENYIFVYLSDEASNGMRRHPLNAELGEDLGRLGLRMARADGALALWEYARSAPETESKLRALGALLGRAMQGTPEDAMVLCDNTKREAHLR